MLDLTEAQLAEQAAGKAPSGEQSAQPRSKKPHSAYMLFVSTARERNGAADGRAAAFSAVQRQWSAMSEEQRRPW